MSPRITLVAKQSIRAKGLRNGQITFSYRGRARNLAAQTRKLKNNIARTPPAVSHVLGTVVRKIYDALAREFRRAVKPESEWGGKIYVSRPLWRAPSDSPTRSHATRGARPDSRLRNAGGRFSCMNSAVLVGRTTRARSFSCFRSIAGNNGQVLYWFAYIREWVVMSIGMKLGGAGIVIR